MIRHMAVEPRLNGACDMDLLRRFRDGQDEGAFLGLLSRHGPMVLNVCRGVLGEEADAEDAFQATFLILAQKAGAIRNTASVGSWLHGVAYRTALKARAERGRRRNHERRPLRREESTRPDDLTWREVQEVIHSALGRVSEPYRAALVLCYLEGRTQIEAARILRVCKATLQHRLEHGRALMRVHLERRGLGQAAVPVTAAWPAAGPASLPAPLVSSTVKIASSIATGQVPAARVVSAKVAALMEGMLTTALVGKCPLTCAALFAATTLGVGLLAFGTAAGLGKAARPQDPPGIVPRAIVGAHRSAGATRPRPLDQALAAAAQVADPEQKARSLLVVAQAQTTAGDRDAALRTLREAFGVADAIPNDGPGDFYVRSVVLSEIAAAQAEAGDAHAAQMSVEAMRAPRYARKGREVFSPDFAENTRAAAWVRIAAAQARAGKCKEANETLGRLDETRREMGVQVFVEIAAAQARRHDWKEAERTTKAIKAELFRIQALVEIARLQAEAGQGDRARAGIAEALRAVPSAIDGDGLRQEYRGQCLLTIALARADVEGVKAALLTAESLPEVEPIDPSGQLLAFPYRELALAELRARAGDIDGAKIAAGAIDDGHVWQRGHASRLIARARADAGDLKGALETAGAIEHAFHKAVAYAEIAQAQARGADRAGAARTFEIALLVAQAVPEARDKSDLDRASHRPALLRTIARAQAAVWEQEAARVWITRQSSPALKAWALVGLSEGLASGQKATATSLGSASQGN
jgi:RNA polymerase sigma factor (sigma-70 family)